MVGWQQQDLAAASGVPKPTISAFELKPETGKLATLNHRAIVEAFEKAGLEFIPRTVGAPGSGSGNSRPRACNRGTTHCSADDHRERRGGRSRHVPAEFKQGTSLLYEKEG